MPAFRKQITSYTVQFASNTFHPRIGFKDENAIQTGDEPPGEGK
jgi:hypothetical protein